MAAQLLGLSHGRNIVLDKPIMLLGRDLECDIRFESHKISRKHCCIAQVGDYLVVRDLGSTNGIRINNVRVLEGCLRPDDELTVGDHRFQVRWDEAAQPIRAAQRDKVWTEPPAQKVPPRQADDEMLELCDEPALSPKSSQRVPGNARPPDQAADALQSPTDEEPALGAPPPASRARDATPLIPDHLELAPSNEASPRRSDDTPP